jgi:hypothetical protein
MARDSDILGLVGKGAGVYATTPVVEPFLTSIHESPRVALTLSVTPVGAGPRVVEAAVVVFGGAAR